jgi:hypothetical protein
MDTLSILVAFGLFLLTWGLIPLFERLRGRPS